VSGRIDAADHVEQGRLAGPRRPHDREVLAAVDVQGDPVQRLGDALPLAVVALYVQGPDDISLSLALGAVYCP